MNDKSLLVNVILKLQDTFKQSDELKSRLKKDFTEVQGAAKIEPKIDPSAIGVVKGKIEELKATLTGMKGAQLTLVDLPSIKASQAAIDGVEREIKMLTGNLGTLQKEASSGKKSTWLENLVKDLNKAGTESHASESKLSEFKNVALGAFTGGAALQGVQSLASGIEKIVDKGKEEAQELNKLTLAYDGNREMAERTAKANETLGEKYNILPSRLNEISSNAAIMGAKSSGLNSKLTELAAGFEKMNIPGVNAEAVLKGMLKGGDEGAEGLGRLNMALPGLASQLAGITDPAEKVNKTLELSKEKFAQLAKNADSQADAGDRFNLVLDKTEKQLGGVLFPILAGLVLPVLGLFLKGIQALVGFFTENIKYIGVLAVAFGIYTIATNTSTISMLAHSAAVNAGAIAQKALNLVQSASPMGIMLAILAVLVVAFMKWADSVGGVGNAFKLLWGVIKGVGEFIKEFISSYVGSLVKAFEGVGKVIDGLIHLNFKEAIEGAKQVGSAVVSAYTEPAKAGAKAFNSTLDETKKSLKTTGDQAKETGASQVESTEKAKKSQEDLTKAINASIAAYQDEEKGVKQGVDTSVGYVEVWRKALEDIARTGHATVKGQVFGPEFVEQIKANIQTAIEHGKQWEAVNRHNEERDKKALEDIVGKEQEANNDQEKNFAERIRIAIDTQKKLQEIGAENIQTERNNVQQKLDNIQKEKTAYVAWVNAHVTDEKQRKKLLKDLDLQELTAKSDLNKALEEIDKHRQEFLDKAHIGEDEKLDAQLGKIRKKYREQNTAVDELVKQGIFSEADSDKAKNEHLLEQQVEEYNLRKTFLQKKEALEDNATRNQMKSRGATGYEIEKALIAQHQKEEIDLLQASNLTREQTLAERNKIVAESNAALDKLEVDHIKQMKETALAEIEGRAEPDYQKQIDSLEVEHTAEIQMQQHFLDTKAINVEEYNKRVSAMAVEYAKKERVIAADNVKQTNLLYQGLSKAVGATFSDMARGIESALGQMFGYEKKQAEGMTANDKKLAQLDHDDKVKKLAEEVAENKISYERYTLERAKLDEDYNKQLKGNKQEQLTFMQQFEKAMTDTVISELAKRGEAYVMDAITQILTNQAEGSSNWIASVLATTPWFVSLPIIAAGLGGVIALFKGVMPKGAAQGLVHDPKRDGALGQMIAIGETGKKEFASPDETAHDYFANDLGPRIYKTATDRAHYAMYASGNIIPRVSPMLSPSFHSTAGNAIEAHTLKEFNKTIKHFVDNGVEFHADHSISGEHIEVALRAHTKSQKNAFSVKGGGVH